MANAAEQRELDLVEKVDLRILSVANNEEKLQQLLRVYLPPLLLKAESENASVRSKVVTVAQRLKTFIQPPGIVLPVETLLDQYKSAKSALLKQLDLIFIQHSVKRLESSEKRQLIPKVLRGIGQDPSDSSLPQIFNVFLQLLPELRVPSRGSKDDEAFRETMGLSESGDAAFIATWLGRLLLFRTGGAGSAHAGLQDSEVKFLTLDKPSTWNAAEQGGLNLAELRIKAAQFLASAAFVDDERFLPALFAAASSDSRISSIGDELLKRTTVSLEDPELIKKLFQAHSILPAAHRTRILGLLSKSAISTTYKDQILALVWRDMEKNNGNSVNSMGSSTPSSAAGLERTKLRKALFEYLGWVARIGSSKADFNDIALPLNNLLREFIEEQGWPVSQNLSGDDVVLREKAYETIGTLSRGTTMDDKEKLSLAVWLFRSLSEDPLSDVVVNVDGALSSLTMAFRPPVSGAESQMLEGVLLLYMTLEEGGSVVRSARHAAVKWANQCLPFSNVKARWIDILAAAGKRGERSDVVEEGRKGLDPWNYRVSSEQAPALPNWSEMVEAFFATPMATFGPSNAPREPGCFVNFPRDAIGAFALAVDYCKRILILSALPDFKLEPGWADRLQTMLHSDLITRQSLRQFLRSPTLSDALSVLLDASFRGMVLDDNAEVAESCGRSFVDLASLAPSALLRSFAAQAADLLPLVRANRKEIRQLAATAFGILAAHPSHSPDAFGNYLSTLNAHMAAWQTAVGSELNAVEGSFMAAGHLCSRRVYYLGREAVNGLETRLAPHFPTASDVSDKLSKSTKEAIFSALEQLWTAGIWLWKDGDAGAGVSEQAKSWITALSAAAKVGSERAITALGRLAIALDATSRQGDSSTTSEELITSLLDKLYDLHELKNVEIQLTIGEAITAAVAAWDANVVRQTLDVDSEATDYVIRQHGPRLEGTMQKILSDCKSTKPSLLKASGIWLFCLIQNCPRLPQIQSRLRECQLAFMGLLSARDTLVQETASRGLSLVYEKGDEALRGELVKDLVSAFTGSGPRLKVEEDTELFDAGALPTGEGSSVTSYKDIVSLANEVGDQTLVYQFMSLASNAATWNTRSAFGRFGLSNILSESEVDPKLYPKLYRYRFDPNSNVRRSMDDIWKALVKDQNAVLDEHLADILQDLLQSILGREWRVREASCAAIAELLQGRPFPKYEKYYQQIWTAALKVLDDVKATVRAAALNLCVSLSNTLVRLLEESGTSVATAAMMKEAVPFLLSDKAIESSVQDVKLFATITVLKISKAGGAALKPYLATVVPQLLGLLSTIEPDELNYQYQRMGDEHREKIDKLRSAWINRSPIMEAIENALRNADAETMPAVAAALEETTKSALGMPTKLGCARVMTILATRHVHTVAPFAGRILKLSERLVLERNDEVSQAYAASAAYMLRAAPSEAQLRYAERLANLYFTADQAGDDTETRREKVADAVLALSKLSPDHFAGLEATLLPLAYFGSHDEDEYVSKAMDEVWGKHAGSSARSVTRFAREIIALAAKALDAPLWALKHAAALTAAGVVGAAAAGSANIAVLKEAWPVYERALALKTFKAKEKLLDVFPDFVEKAPPGLNLAATLRKIVIRESKRNNEAYRPYAFRCLWRYARVSTASDAAMPEEIIGIVTPALEAYRDKQDEMDVDGAGGGNKESKREKEDSLGKTADGAVEAVAKGYRPEELGEETVGHIIKVLKPFLTSAGFDVVRRRVWYRCVAEIMEDINKQSKPKAVDGALALDYIATLDLDSPATGTEEQRLSRAKAVLTTLKASKTAIPGVEEKVTNALEAERSMEVRKVWKDVLAQAGSSKV